MHGMISIKIYHIKERRRDWKLKEEALDDIPWRNGFLKFLWLCPKTDYVIVT
jgi:hypothetical protein